MEESDLGRGSGNYLHRSMRTPFYSDRVSLEEPGFGYRIGEIERDLDGAASEN